MPVYGDVLGVLFEKALKESIHVLGNASFVVIHAGTVREPGACWLINVEEIRFAVPRVSLILNLFKQYKIRVVFVESIKRRLRLARHVFAVDADRK